MVAAITDYRWRDVMSSELTALMSHNTWQLVPPPAKCNIVGLNGYFELRGMLMVLLTVLRPDLWPKDSIKDLD